MADKIATRDAYGEALVQLGGENSQIVVLDADLSKSTKTVRFAKKFPDRFFNLGISEADLMGTAAGLAAAGKIPFASTFAVFATGRAFDQIRNSIAYPGLNVKIAATHAGLTVGEDGGSHQAVEDIALMRVIPGMTVLVPSDGICTKKLVAEAAALKGPVYLRLGRPAVPVIYGADEEFVIGRAKVLKPGNDLTLVASGIMVAKSLEAAEILEKQGINARVLDMHTIKPLDGQSLEKAARETGGIVTVEEHSVIGGLGGAVAEFIAENCPVPVLKIGIQDSFGESGKPDELLIKYGLTVERIVEFAEKLKKLS